MAASSGAPIPTSRLQTLTTVIQGRWFVLAVGIVVMIASAGAYSFSVYSQKLKAALNINQEMLNVIANFKDLGVNFGLISGLLYDFWTPGGVLFIGALETIAGYSLAWLSVTKRIPPSVWQMCLFLFVGANSQSMLTTAVIVQTVKLFPASKGVIIGLMKGYIGISGAILIQIYVTIQGTNNPESFLLLLIWLPSTVALLSILVIRPLKPFQGLPEGKYIYWFLALGFALAFYLMGVSVTQNLINVSRSWELAIGCILLILLFIPLLIITYRAEVYGKRSGEGLTGCGDNELRDIEDNDVQIMPTEQILFVTTKAGLETSKSLKQDEKPDLFPSSGLKVTTSLPSNFKIDGSIPETDHQRARKETLARDSIPQQFVTDSNPVVDLRKAWPKKGEDHTIWQTYRSMDFWLLFIATTFGIGSGLTVTDNMGQLGLSLGYATPNVRTFVSLVSIWNAIGRWVGGFVSDFLLRHYGISRTNFLAVMMGLMAIAFLLIAVNVPGCLYFGSIFLGLSFGAQYPMYATIVADIFGLKYYATLYNSIGLASPVGMYILSVPVVGRFYDANAKKEAGGRSMATSSLTCYGASCFGHSLLVLMGVTFGAAVCAVALWYRTRHLYREIYENYQQMRTEEQAKLADRENTNRN